MELTVVTTQEMKERRCWIEKISRLSGNFGVDADRVQQELSDKIQRDGLASLLGHLRLCGVIPEGYGHDSSEEKLYSKYTDAVIHEAYTAMGFTSLVLKERADAADVECVCADYSFVADAKTFRLSRTAKNQKDFKIQALDTWKHGKSFAMVVCPVYQLPVRTSQIYQQAAARSVCICTYTHLAVLVRYAESVGRSQTISLLHNIFKAVEAMNPSQNAGAYWQTLNRTLLDVDDSITSV
jgi:type II restriction enzyme